MREERKAVVQVWFGPGGEDGIELPQTAFTHLQVVESANMLAPTFEVSVIDPFAIYLDEVGCAWATVRLSRTKDEPGFLFRGAVLSMPEASPPYAKEFGRQPRLFRGVVWHTLPLFTTSVRRSFGLSSASSVFKTTVEQALQPVGARVSFKVEPSIDRSRYLCPGWTPAQFIVYLASKAVAPGGVGGYMGWTDLTRERGGFSAIRACFCTPSYLARQPVVHRIVVTQDPDLLTEAEERGGTLEDGTKVALGFSYQYQTAFSISDYGRVVSGYDTVSEQTWERYFTYDDFNFVSLGSKKFRHRYDPLYTTPAPRREIYAGENAAGAAKVVASSTPHLTYFKRHTAVLLYGREDVHVGDKVQLKVPLAFKDKPQVTALAGEWVVTRVVHLVSAPDYLYLMKVILSRDEYLGEV